MKENHGNIVLILVSSGSSAPRHNDLAVRRALLCVIFLIRGVVLFLTRLVSVIDELYLDGSNAGEGDGGRYTGWSLVRSAHLFADAFNVHAFKVDRSGEEAYPAWR